MPDGWRWEERRGAGRTWRRGSMEDPVQLMKDGVVEKGRTEWEGREADLQVRRMALTLRWNDDDDFCTRPEATQISPRARISVWATPK